MVICIACPFCESSLYVSQQEHYNIFFNTLQIVRELRYKKKGNFWYPKMLMFAQAKVDDLLAREYHKLLE